MFVIAYTAHTYITQAAMLFKIPQKKLLFLVQHRHESIICLSICSIAPLLLGLEALIGRRIIDRLDLFAAGRLFVCFFTLL